MKLPEKVREMRAELERVGVATPAKVSAPREPTERAPTEPALELTVTLVSDRFQAPAEGVTHVASVWELRQLDGSYELDPSYTLFTAEHLTELTLPAGLLLPGRVYRWRVAHIGSDGRSPGFLPEKSFSTAPFPVELVPIDLSPVFNRDVIADPGDGEGVVHRPGQAPALLSELFLTQGIRLLRLYRDYGVRIEVELDEKS